MATDFPKSGDDLKVSLRNSEYPQFDRAFAENIREFNPEVWRAGGNIRGNEAFTLWGRARDGEETEGVLAWIKEREAWAARHFQDGAQFQDGDLEPNLSNVGGVVAQMKWGVIGNLSEQGMKDVILELVKKLEERAISDLTDNARTALERKVEDHNEEHGDDPTKRATLAMLAESYLRGIGAYQTNPGSVRPGVQSAEQWAMARVNSLLFALRTGRFQGGKHDTDLLPEGHPEASTAGEDARPYPNEHAARITDPGQYDSFARVNDALGDGIDAIYGVKDGEGSELQAIRFDAARFSADEARSWLRENDFSPIKFEEATGERAEPMSEELDTRHVLEVMETDETVTIVLAKDHTEPMAVEAEDDIEDDLERKKSTAIHHRAMGMDAEVEDDRRVRMSISSEKPVERSYGMEILDHDERSIDLSFLNSGNAPLLLDHDPERQIGVIESVNLDTSARRLRATVRFSKSALGSEVLDDVRDGIRKNVSIGYRVGRMEHDDKAKGGNTYRARVWTPMEASIVSIPADETVGVGRKAEIKSPANPAKMEAQMSEHEIQAVEARAREDYAKTVNEILELGAAKNKRDLANQAIKDGLTVAQFRGVLAFASADQPIDAPEAVGLNRQERKQYSLLSAFRSAAAGRDIGGFEREISDEIAKRTGKEARGFYIPTDIFKRDLIVGTDTAGGFLKPTDHLGGEFIDALRANLVIANLGARMMSGLKGDVAIPALNAKTAVGFVAENTAPGSEGAPTFRQVTMAPRTIAQYVDLSRKLMMQSDPSVEQVIRDDMLRQFAAKIDEVAIEGGGSNEPTGITQTSGIGSVAIGTNGGAITYAAAVNLEREVAIDNALGGRLSYLTNPKVVAAMRTTSRQASGVEGNFILNDSNTLLGYGVASSTLVPSDLTKGTSEDVCSALIFGNFADLMIGMFGGLDVLVDPYSGSTTGATRISMFQDIDVAVRHAESFAAILDITTA
jgi:HK97 family phage major capsid protein/HK97 family phage prohead protease